MKMYLSVGASTIAALMAAHRTGRDRPIPATLDQTDIALISPDPFAVMLTNEPERFYKATKVTIRHQDRGAPENVPQGKHGWGKRQADTVSQPDTVAMKYAHRQRGINRG
jgi:hypothetical protein